MLGRGGDWEEGRTVVLMYRANEDLEAKPCRRPALDTVLNSPLVVVMGIAPDVLDTCSCDHVDASLPNATGPRIAALAIPFLPVVLSILATRSPAIIVVLCAPPGAMLYERRKCIEM